jgi:multiple sugar transport system substrate-binding protein
LDLENNYPNASYYSKFYNFPAFNSVTPQLLGDDSWLDDDPWGAQPPDKLKLLKTAEDWTVWPGYPGYAHPAIGEVYESHLLSSMMADVARGEKTPEEAVKSTAAEIEAVFKKWRDRGYVGDGS